MGKVWDLKINTIRRMGEGKVVIMNFTLRVPDSVLREEAHHTSYIRPQHTGVLYAPSPLLGVSQLAPTPQPPPMSPVKKNPLAALGKYVMT